MGGVKGKFLSRDSSKKYDVTPTESQQQCGVLCIKGGPLQKCAQIRYFVAAGSFYTLAYVMVNLYLVGIITTIERRFGFSSSSSGMLLSIKELAMVGSTLLMTHLARNVHKPRFLSIMGLCGAVGSALSLIPHFISYANEEPYVAVISTDDVIATVCKPLVETTMANTSRTEYSVGQCQQSQGAMFNYVAYSFFSVTSVIIGLSYCSVTALITTYVDDAASSKNNAIYLGIMIAMKPVGPLLAFVLGAIFTSFHESLLDPGYGAGNPRWVGAWWLGYILCPSFLIVSSLIISMFPKHLPHEAEEDDLKESDVAVEAYSAVQKECEGKFPPVMPSEKKNTSVYTVKTTHASNIDSTDNLELMEKEIMKQDEPMSVRMQMLKGKKKDNLSGSKESLLGGLVQSLRRLIDNPVFVLLSIGLCFTAFIIAGMLPFFPKYLEVYFNLTASMANVLAGFTCAFPAALGVLFGGLIVSRFELNTRSCCLFILVTDIACVCCMVGMMLCECKQPQQDSFLYSNVTCEKSCECTNDIIQPICGSNGITYMSPCIAGCKNLFKNQTYGECQCIDKRRMPDNLKYAVNMLEDGQAVPGVCKEWCTLFIPYLILASFAPLFGMMASVPAMTIILRTVKAEDRSLGISFTSALVSLASFVPAPLVFGTLIDASCSQWQTSCGERGACVLYNNNSFRYRYHGASAVFKSGAALMTFLMWLAARRRVVHNKQQQMKHVREMQKMETLKPPPTSLSSPDHKAILETPLNQPAHTAELTAAQQNILVPPPVDFSPNEREDYPHSSDFLQEFESVI